MAEETGLIVPIGRWVLSQACHQLRAWQYGGVATSHLAVNVNLSGRQFADPSLIDDVKAILAETGLDSTCLTLEITESAAMQDAEAAEATLRVLKSLGVRLAIDDFGTGYSGLAYLKRFAVDILKVDRSFVSGLGTNAEDTSIVSAILALGHALGLETTAEGIETVAQLNAARRLGCQRGQGFLLSRPAPADAIVSLLNSSVLPEPIPFAAPRAVAA
jgi:EAL domain-containing protein (putative c-di-GMP-specific phosphodiesterase class I)